MKANLLLSLLTLTSLSLISKNSIYAQTYTPSNRIPVADSTLNTQVSGSGNNFNITGGLTKGQTLFHSFTDFSVPTNGQANFTNPVGNRDIITRVTGNVFSDINGLVNTNGANFFLLNPNGITFGTGAQLNVGKAFVGSTANSIDLVSSNGTINFGTNQNGDALLKIAPNVLFDLSRLNIGGGTGAISNFGTLQTQNNSQYIGLIGGNVTLDGSGGGGKIIAPGGRVDLGGLNTDGTVSFSSNGLVFSGNNLIRGDVLLTNGALVNVAATKESGAIDVVFGKLAARGSNININADRLNMFNASIYAGLSDNSGSQSVATGDININATGVVTLDNATIANVILPDAQGQIGGIGITANSLNLSNESNISTVTQGNGNAGNIQIDTAGDISISGTTPQSTVAVTASSTQSTIGSFSNGKGNAGKVTINTQNLGNISLSNKAFIISSIDRGAVGNGNDISISARSIDIQNNSFIASDNLGGEGNAGNIAIITTGDLSISSVSGFAGISSNTNGMGDAGKITIDTQNLGEISLSNNAGISSLIAPNAIGNGNDISISARSVDIQNNSSISSDNIGGNGNAGNIIIKTTGDLSIAGTNGLSAISSNTNGTGDAGKVTIDTQNLGKVSLSNNAGIYSLIAPNAIGNGNDISISARSVDIENNSLIVTNNIGGKGDAGDIIIKTTGDINVSGSAFNSTESSSSTSRISAISSATSGRGNAGKITIDTQKQGKFSLSHNAGVFSDTDVDVVGNANDINISAREIEVKNQSRIGSISRGTGNSGNIKLETSGDIRLVGTAPNLTKPITTETDIFTISTSVAGQGNTGKITIDTNDRGKLLLSDNAIIASVILKKGVGSGQDISISARSVEIQNQSVIASSNIGGKGDAGNINIKAIEETKITNESGINSTNFGTGATGNIIIDSDQVTLNNTGSIDAKSTGFTGGNIQITTRDRLLLRNSSSISTTSDSIDKNGDGGNIKISSPLIIATPGNNDISANAIAGNGGKVNITSQGLFGIKFRPTATSFTNDITASSTFGQSGTVSVDTPGTDPGKDSTELPNTTSDASNQISQVCSANNRQNKLTVTGRGGLPPTADDPLTSDVVWQDARATSSQPAISSATPQLAPPAVGWVFDGKGKVTLVAAGTQGSLTKTSVVCPTVENN